MFPGFGTTDKNQDINNLELSTEAFDDTFKEHPRRLRQDQTLKLRKKIDITQGKSIGLEDFEDVDGDLNHPPTSLPNETKPFSFKVMPKNRNSRKNKKSRTDIDSSSEDDGAYSVHDRNDELILPISDSFEPNKNISNLSDANIPINNDDYTLVQYIVK